MRKIWAEIDLDEEVANHYRETNLMEDVGDLDYFVQEFGWLSESGFGLNNAAIGDFDDPDKRARYISYLFEWAMDAAGDENRKDSPLSFEDWAENEDWF